jgi:hypothetical protein
MFCSSCGVALPQPMKYCNRCGAQLVVTRDAAEIGALEKRLDEYLDGLFWITVFGVGLTLGGMALIKRALELGEAAVIAFLILCATAFLVNFALSFWQVLRMTRDLKELRGEAVPDGMKTGELNPADARASLAPPPSVTETTTRTLEPAPAAPRERPLT